MCLYPRLERNQKYQSNKKNGGVIPPVYDTRVLHVPIACGKCMECRKQKAREWKVRLLEDIKKNKNAHFITLTFSNQAIKAINELQIKRTLLGYSGLIENVNIKDLSGYQKDNAIAKKAVRLFLERWRKKHKTSLRHWLVTELGHKGTENIHLHGLVWTDTPQDIGPLWKYGYVWDGYNKNGKRINYVNQQTINYIVKYIHKADIQHKTYQSKVLTSPGMGRDYTTSFDVKKNKFNESNTNETYRTPQGHKMALPTYWRNKLYNEQEREALWLHKLDKMIRYVDGQEIDISQTEEHYYAALENARDKNKKLGYGDNSTNWKRQKYEEERRDLMTLTRIQASGGVIQKDIGYGRGNHT